MRFRVNIFYPTPARGRVERLHVCELRNCAEDIITALESGARFSVRDAHKARELRGYEAVVALSECTPDPLVVVNAVWRSGRTDYGQFYGPFPRVKAQACA